MLWWWWCNIAASKGSQWFHGAFLSRLSVVTYWKIWLMGKVEFWCTLIKNYPYFPWLDFSRLLDYCSGYLKEKHYPKNETLANFSRFNHICPGLEGIHMGEFQQGEPLIALILMQCIYTSSVIFKRELTVSICFKVTPGACGKCREMGNI